MTIKTQTARHVVVADGLTTRFTFTFQTQSPADIYVGLEQTLISTGFTITLHPDQATTPGGYVDFITAPTNGQRVTIFRWTIFTQEMFYSAYDPFPAKSHERALDTLAMQIQQLEDQVSRSYKVPWWVTDEEIPPPGGSTGGEYTMPPPSPGDTLVWNAGGTGFDNAPGEGDFLTWVNEAQAGAASAANSAVAASDSAALAAKWADLYPAEVVSGRYSAKFWATRAQEWAESMALVAGTGYSAKYWADEAASWVNGALKSVTTDDPEMISVTAALNTATLNIHSNRAYGTVKLTSNGLIPPELMPAGGINLLGPFRGDDLCPKYGDETGECIEPDYRNPSQRWPDYVFHTGNSFIIIMKEGETSGHVNAINDDTELQEPIEVFAGDGLIYFEKDVLDGTTVVIKAGWHVERGWVTGGAVIAANVLYDNSLGYWVSENLQSLGDEIGQKAVTLAGVDQVITARKIFTGNVVLSNGTYLQGNDTNGVPRNLAELSINNSANFGVVAYPLYLISSLNPRWYDGTTDRWLATQDWVLSLGTFSTDVAHAWGATQTFNVYQIFNSYIVAQNSGIDGASITCMTFQTPQYGTTYRHLVLSSVSSVPSNSWLEFYICNGADTWQAHMRLRGDGYAIFPGNVNAPNFYAGSGFYSAGVAVLSYAGNGTYVGATGVTAMYLQAVNPPAWYDGTTVRGLATEQWVNSYYLPKESGLHLPAAGGFINTLGGINGAFGGLQIIANTGSGYWTLQWTAPVGKIGPICFATVSEDSTSRIVSVTVTATNQATVSIRDAGTGARMNCGFNFLVIFTTAG